MKHGTILSMISTSDCFERENEFEFFDVFHT